MEGTYAGVNPARLDFQVTKRRLINRLGQITNLLDGDLLLELCVVMGVEPKFQDIAPEYACHHHHCCDSENQPRGLGKRHNFGRLQVKCPCQIKVGSRYNIRCSGTDKPTPVFVAREPYDRNGRMFADLIIGAFGEEPEPTGEAHPSALEGLSVVPYHPGGWDGGIWLEFTSESRPPCCCGHLECHPELAAS